MIAQVYHISMTIQSSGISHEVKFDYDNQLDTIPKVSEDLVEALGLPPSSLPMISTEITNVLSE